MKRVIYVGAYLALVGVTIAGCKKDVWIVQIGEYLYRVNKTTESFYVLHAENISEYQDLVSENKSNFHIRKFSKNGDVMFTSCIMGKGEI